MFPLNGGKIYLDLSSPCCVVDEQKETNGKQPTASTEVMKRALEDGFTQERSKKGE